MELTVRVRHEGASYWAEVVELPGCFASGDSFDELLEGLREAIDLYLEDARPSDGSLTLRVAEIKVATSPLQPA